MVNIVTLSNHKRYMVDVGFGANGPIRPLLLDAENSQTYGIQPAEIRLVYENIPQNTDPGQKLWIYQHRNDPSAEWVAVYCFTELEFLPQDYEIMNFWTSRSRKSWFTQRIVVVRMEMEGGEVMGTIMLDGAEVKMRVGGETKLVFTCKTEGERVGALEEWFGIVLGEDERRGIRGMVSEIKG